MVRSTTRLPLTLNHLQYTYDDQSTIVNSKWMFYGKSKMVNSKRMIVLVVHNVRSCHNVGSLFRTAEGLGVKKLFLTGYSPYPTSRTDTRLPHIAHKIHSQIAKTALGAEQNLAWQHHPNIVEVIDQLNRQHYSVTALEQTKKSQKIMTWQPPEKIALIVGNEVTGIEPETLTRCQTVISIPMFGKKESFNVVQAAAMALFYTVFAN